MIGFGYQRECRLDGAIGPSFILCIGGQSVSVVAFHRHPSAQVLPKRKVLTSETWIFPRLGWEAERSPSMNLGSPLT